MIGFNRVIFDCIVSRAGVQNYSLDFESRERKRNFLATFIGNKHSGYRDV